MKSWIAIASALLLAGCGEGGQSNGAAPEANEATPTGNAAVADAGAPAAAPRPAACPFRGTEGWGGAIEGGRLVVNGAVDLQMAGMRPTLTPRPGAGGGSLAFDLTLAPEPSAPITDRVRYEGPGGAWRRGEIWCGGERIAEFDIVAID